MELNYSYNKSKGFFKKREKSPNCLYLTKYINLICCIKFHKFSDKIQQDGVKDEKGNFI